MDTGSAYDVYVWVLGVEAFGDVGGDVGFSSFYLYTDGEAAQCGDVLACETQ